jgi:hypothetical protein
MKRRLRKRHRSSHILEPLKGSDFETQTRTL